MQKDSENPKGERTIYSVSALTSVIKDKLEQGFPDVLVQGEISNCRVAPSGHAYFTIKDAGAVLQAVLFKGSRRYCDAELNDGTRAVFRGSISLYARKGSYQLIVRSARQTGLGTLHLRFEQLKKQLYREGLFDQARKKPVPFCPEQVAVVTSPGAAALQDILRVSYKRFPGISIIIYPAQVQGESAADEIVTALKQADRDRLADVIILARGGGSLEDLWPFNEEQVARTIAACNLPVVSGVGHEIDYSITDFTADLRAATPSAAAELVFPDRGARLAEIHTATDRNRHLLLKRMEFLKNRLLSLSGTELHRRLQQRVEQAALQLDERRDRLIRSAQALILNNRATADTLTGRLSVLDPRAPLRKGYSIVRDKCGKILRRADKLKKEDTIAIEFGHGSADASVTAVRRQ